MEGATGNSEILIYLHNFVEQIQLQRFRTNPEKSTQSDVEQFLNIQEFGFVREKQLSKRDIPDFLIKSRFGKIALEVKTKCSRMAIYRQLERYAAHDEVIGLILLTGTSMGLPTKINGKYSLIASLGAGWL